MAVATLLIETHPGAMSLETDDIEGPDQEQECTETNKRSERKRQREKQRRSDLSNAFDELAAFVVQFVPEPGPGDTDLEGKKKRKKSGEGEDSSGITRVDLIGRALKMIKRLHKENEERKRIISTMQDRGARHGPTDNVLVMVPTAPSPVVDDNTYPVARAVYPSSYYPPVSSQYHQRSSPVPPHGGAPDHGVVAVQGHGPTQQYQERLLTHWGHDRYRGPPPHHHPPPVRPPQSQYHVQYGQSPTYQADTSREFGQSFF